jgi:DNA-binding NtrC family response regulator
MATARELGIDKNTLRRKMKRYRLTDPSPSRSESSSSDSFHL